MKTLNRSFYRIGLFLVLFSFTSKLDAQQDPVFSQYMMNAYLVNPAIAGSAGYTEFSLTAREQWVGFAGTPKTHLLCAQTRILRNSFINKNASVKRKHKKSSRSGRVGLGGYLFNDKTGSIGRTGFQVTYSYHIDLHNSQLSFGVSTKAYQYKLNDDILMFENDDYFNSKDKAYFIPDANFGVYYMTSDYFGGFSISNMFQSSVKFGNSGNNKEDQILRHYYFLGGYKFTINNYLIAEPSILLKTNQIGYTQLDINSKVYYNNDYWAGLSFRTGGDLIVMGGARIENIYFGYAFDYATSDIMRHTFGSHEFMIAMRFGDSARRYRWLNRY